MQLTEVEVMRLGLDRSNNSYVVILKEKEGERLLPIWIGQPEAESIVIEMSKLRRDRPLTHDLCKTLITGLGGRSPGPGRTRGTTSRGKGLIGSSSC